MPLFSHASAFSRITTIAALRPVHAAFAWIHGNPKTLLDWQIELCGIPAPPFGERARGEWLTERFREIGLIEISTDTTGNVRAFLPAPHLDADSTGPIVVLSAHLDTVFPPNTKLAPRLRQLDGVDRIEAPGACDNAAGVIGMLAIAKALVHARVEFPVPLLFLGNVGEEGEGDLRGVRHLYSEPLAGRIAAHIVLDGAGADSAVTQALGSRRYQVTITGPGGHSFTDSGTVNPIAALSTALSTLAMTRLPDDPRTTLNLGTIHGGTSVNSIPESATATVDFRSTGSEELLRLEVALHRAVEDAVEMWNAAARSAGMWERGLLKFAIACIGNRPAAQLPEDSPILEALQSVDRHLGLPTSMRLGSTDANIPISLGVPALSLGAGGEGSGAHTLAEWYSPKDRELGLRRILLLTLAMAEWAAEQ